MTEDKQKIIKDLLDDIEAGDPLARELVYRVMDRNYDMLKDGLEIYNLIPRERHHRQIQYSNRALSFLSKLWTAIRRAYFK